MMNKKKRESISTTETLQCLTNNSINPSKIALRFVLQIKIKQKRRNLKMTKMNIKSYNFIVVR